MMRTFLLLFISSLLATPVYAANHYIRDGGTGDGSAWDNAWDQVPSTMTRGDTYYVADGAYTNFTIDDAESGTTRITLQKATGTDHGTETGWSSAYGDGSATFSGSTEIRVGYVTIDGVTGSFNNARGFKFATTANHAIRIRDMHLDYRNINGLEFKHLELYNSNAPTSANRGFTASQTSVNGALFHDLYMHDNSVPFHLWYGHDYTIEYSWIEDNRSIAGAHVEGVITAWNGSVSKIVNIIVRYNVWKDIVGTGVVMMSGANHKVYGNLFYWTSDHGTTINNGVIGTWSGVEHTSSGVQIYNNTFVDIKTRLYPIGSNSGHLAKNNLFYNVWNISIGTKSIGWGSTSHDYSWFRLAGTQSETNIQNGAGDPFADYAGDGFTLASATNAGTTLSSEYNTDMYGDDRGFDGTWDRGYDEYVAGTPPSSVTSQSATGGNQQITLNWTNPADADFAGARIRSRTDTYPTSPTNGTLVADNTGSASATDSQVHSSLNVNQIYYYSIYAYDASDNYAAGVTTSASTDTNVNIHNILRGGSIAGDMK